MNRRLLLKSLFLPVAALGCPAILAAAPSALEQLVEREVAKMRKAGLIAANERTAWVVSDLRSGKKLVSINENDALQCASMVKPFVIQAYLMAHFLKSPKRYPLSAKVLYDMRQMIVHSNNASTDRIMARVGGPAGVQWMLKKHAPQIFKNVHVREFIPLNGRTYKNTASAADYDRFLRALWAGKLPGADILRALMGIPNHDRIRSETQRVNNPHTKVYDKTGSTSRLCGDMGIIVARQKNGRLFPYTFVGIIQKAHSARAYPRWITERSDAMRAVSDAVYTYLSAQNHFLS